MLSNPAVIINREHDERSVLRLYMMSCALSLELHFVRIVLKEKPIWTPSNKEVPSQSDLMLSLRDLRWPPTTPSPTGRRVVWDPLRFCRSILNSRRVSQSFATILYDDPSWNWLFINLKSSTWNHRMISFSWYWCMTLTK